MYTAAAIAALAGLAAAHPQATTTSSSPPAITSVGPAYERTQNFSISIQNSEPSLNGLIVQQAHVAAGQNAVVFRDPTVYGSYISFLEGTPKDVEDKHAYLQQYLPNSTLVYGVKVTAPQNPGELSMVFAEPGDQSEAFGVYPTFNNQLVHSLAEQNADFYACSEEIGGLDTYLVLKYGTIDGEAPKDCNVIELFATYQ